MRVLTRFSPRTAVRRIGAVSLTAAMVVGLVLVGSAAGAATSSVSTVTAEDSFDRTVASGLSTAPIGGVYTTFGESILSVASGAAKVNALLPGKSAGAFLTQESLDTTVQSSVVVPNLSATTLYYGVEARKQFDGSAYRGRARITTSGQISVSFTRTLVSNETSLGTKSIPLVLGNNQKLMLELEVTGTNPVHLAIRAWLDGSAQPAWQYQLDDQSAARIASPGSVGFWMYSSGSGKSTSLSIPAFHASTAIDQLVKPSASTTGVPAGTVLTNYTGPLTITLDGTVIDSKHVYGDLRVQAKNVVIRNSYLHGGATIPKSNTGVIDANSANVYNLLIENNTIYPDHPSYYRDGIVGHEFTAVGNHITRSNDGIGIFNRPGGALAANVKVEENYIHDLTHWNSDPAHSDGTHNDGIQIQGGQNILIRGNNVVGSVVAGDGLGAFGLHGGSALLAKPDVSEFANLVIENNWFDDAQNSVCLNNGKYPTMVVTFQNNFFGRHQYAYSNNSTYQIRIYVKSATQATGLATNRWEDTNELLTEGRDTGIRYNAQ